MADQQNGNEEPLASPDDERPPFWSWAKIYAVVLGALAVQVVVYALLCRGVQ